MAMQWQAQFGDAEIYTPVRESAEQAQQDIIDQRRLHPDLGEIGEVVKLGCAHQWQSTGNSRPHPYKASNLNQREYEYRCLDCGLVAFLNSDD